MRTRKHVRPSQATWVLRTTRDLAEFIGLNVAADRLSISAVAERAGLCWQTVDRLIDGDTKDPRLSTAIKLLRTFGYDVTVRKNGHVEARG